MLAVAITSTTTPCAAIKVLGLFPHPAISHFRFFEPVLRELAAAGHDVTVVGLFPWKEGRPANYHDVVIPGEVLTGAIDLQVSTLCSLPGRRQPEKTLTYNILTIDFDQYVSPHSFDVNARNGNINYVIHT